MKKIQARQLFDGVKFWNSTPVVVLNNEKIIDIIDVANAGDDILKIEGVLCPAFVNAHCHLELSLFHHKISKHTGMSSFLQQVVSLKKKNLRKK